ncbi:MAG: sigma 54-interacting transcriptional regulator [Desulfobulbales bacterium]|nr:sigma 54-interacting transcriptional regulator [Desulfobulbales bacterium]
MKKIGEYLIENNLCDAATLGSALEEQLKLKENSVYRPLGSILTGSYGLARQDLDRALALKHNDIISRAPLFKDISKEAIAEILSLAEQKILPAGSVVFNTGERTDSFFIVISGNVKGYTVSSEGIENTFTEFRKGECFGETSLLTGEPHKYATKTTVPTSFLVLSKKNFFHLCTRSEISMIFIKGFANRLLQRDAEIARAGEKEWAYQQFVSQQEEPYLPELIGQSMVIKRLREKIDGAAQNGLPVLITGEPGTEGEVVAGNIHKNSPDSGTPFLSMDADDIALEGYGGLLGEDTSGLQMELAQSGILFGSEDTSFPLLKHGGLGLLQICSQGCIVIKNVEKLSPGVQEKLLQYLRSGTFMPVGGRETISSKARIIATTSENLGNLSAQGKFNHDLLELLQANVMKVPPLRKRKGDLRLLVDFIIIMECFKTPGRKLIKGLSPEAYQRIMEYDWPGNMDELQIVIRRAIILAHGDYLMPDDIFIGMTPPEGKYTINLFQFDRIKKIFKSPVYPFGLQAFTAVVFTLILILAFTGNQAADKNIALILVWGMWEPLLVISWFFGARIWCAACPMGGVNDLLNRIGKWKLKVPAFIHDYGVYFSAAGLAAVIWAETVTLMPYSPKATGYLLLAIALFAILSGILFERRAWCRYLCPLGGLGGVYSGCATVELRSNSSICYSTCKNNSCYTGEDDTPFCPMYEGPFSLHSNHNCILCGNCIKACPNDSPAVNLRIPGHELWAGLKTDRLTSVFVPVILGTQLFRGFIHTSFGHDLGAGIKTPWALYGILLSAATVIAFAYTRISGTVAFSRLKNSNLKKGNLFIHAIIPLAFVFEIVYQLKPLLTRLGHFLPTLGRQFGFALEYWDFAYQPNSIKPWQVLLLLFGILVSMGFLRALIKNHQQEEGGRLRYRRLRYLPIILLGCIYIGMFVVY